MKKVLPKVLPILLIVGTLLALALTSFAGEEGVRLAIVEKANKAVTLDGIKDDVYKDSVALGDAANASHGTLFVTWDKDNLYFFADIVDPKIKEFVALYGSNWSELLNLTKDEGSEAIAHKVNGEGDAKQMMQFLSWTTPSFEIVIDPSNTAQEAATTLWQARVSFDNYKVFFQYADETYNSYETSTYPDGNEKKVRFTSETKYDLEAGTYSVEMCVPRKSLGFLNDELTDHQMISINAFYYSIETLPTAETVAEKQPTVKSNYVEKVTVLGDTYTVPSLGGNWNAPKFSFLRLWDPSVTANESDFGTETTKATTTIKKVDGGEIITKKPKVTTTKKQADQPTVTTQAPKESGGCGSVIGAGAAVLASLMIVPTAMLLKKKHED